MRIDLHPRLLKRAEKLHRRIVFFAEKGLLTAYDVMTHDEIKAWLRQPPIPIITPQPVRRRGK